MDDDDIALVEFFHGRFDFLAVLPLADELGLLAERLHEQSLRIVLSLLHQHAAEAQAEAQD